MRKANKYNQNISKPKTILEKNILDHLRIRMDAAKANTCDARLLWPSLAKLRWTPLKSHRSQRTHQQKVSLRFPAPDPPHGAKKKRPRQGGLRLASLNGLDGLEGPSRQLS